MSRLRNLALAGVSILSFSAQAIAQEGPPADDEDRDHRDIVVTGTLVRGIAPAGANVIGLSDAKVEETGAATVSQLLQTIPQFGSFNAFQSPVGGQNFQTTNRPNLRNLPGFTTTGSAATLMLVDGHRVVGMGIQSTSPDADIVPPGIIERVDIIPDGGSALYGSDAVAGVINFITRKKINGIEVDGRYGFANDYYQWDANVTAGKNWGSGSISASYNYSEHGDFLGRDRDYVKMYPTLNGGIALPLPAVECPVGNVNVRLSPDVYGLPFTTATAANRRNVASTCDLSDYVSIYPSERRHSIYAGLNQELSDWLTFDVRGFYMNRKMSQSLGLYHTTVLVGTAPVPGVTFSPFAAAHSVSGGFELQNVSFAYGPDDAQRQRIGLSAWGVTPSFTARLDDNWEARVIASYSESRTHQRTSNAHGAALTNAIAAGLFNPYDPTSSNPAAVAAIANFENMGLTRQQQTDLRLTIDGDLISLPGGAAKLAVGGEYIADRLMSQKGSTAPGFADSGFGGTRINGIVVQPAIAPIPRYKLGRNVSAVFGELVLPIFGAENRITLMEELTLSVSGRYDHYSDVGGTFNPKIGITWRPALWAKLRGSWGKAFAAPSLADSNLSDPTTVSYQSGGFFTALVPPAVLAANGYPVPAAGQTSFIILQGTKEGVRPQTAKTWSAGIDIDPPFAPGLRLSATYFRIDYKNLISQPPFTSIQQYFRDFGSTFIVNPTLAQVNAALAQAPTVGNVACAPLPSCVYIIEDTRKQNLGNFKLSGIDFNLAYNRDTSFGSVDLSVMGSYELTRKQSATATSAFRSLLSANNSRLKMRSSIGGWFGSLRGQVTWSHSAGYDLDPAVGVPATQTRVKSFNVFDLFFKYDLAGEGMGKDVSFTLNVNNVLDQDPPLYRASSITLLTNGYANGATVGRLVQFGVAKKF